ncbi:MAG: hydroxymethylbilane synthase [Porphyromonas sp.]|nr:hydroxymethylbilane synthase [Porphyromonas sp.]
MNIDTFIIGTRGSKLALAQAEQVKRELLLAYPDLEVELRIIKTKGDKRMDLSLNASGDKGLFTKELEEALFAGEIDCAVHSLKDLPVELCSGTSFGAILRREQVNDVLISVRYKSLAELPNGAIVGTSSPRRAAQLLEQRSDLDIREIRGNVDTRLAKLDNGEYDAIVMAYAGLKRLGLEERITQILPEVQMVPAPGQGAIAVQIKSDREDYKELLKLLHHDYTARCVEVERYILSKIGGGCAVPFGCNCSVGLAKEQVQKDEEGIEVLYVLVYDCNDIKQSLKAIIVPLDLPNEEIWKYLQEECIPVSRERVF